MVNVQGWPNWTRCTFKVWDHTGSQPEVNRKLIRNGLMNRKLAGSEPEILGDPFKITNDKRSCKVYWYCWNLFARKFEYAKGKFQNFRPIRGRKLKISTWNLPKPIRWGATGASKRGWTTWTLGAVDYERIIFISPVWLDNLNLIPSTHHHYRHFWMTHIGDS